MRKKKYDCPLVSYVYAPIAATTYRGESQPGEKGEGERRKGEKSRCESGAKGAVVLVDHVAGGAD